ncbi:hypothetical protein AGRA3207_000225 [Actinomadura graeca]|uniref:Uncharacterized protein n=1 Tax=Actinomadura graeca TaxID=2750812 RepID=A0ABX8QLV7_9ACTN|nr:hypothetical protein [Actinomadura graeca]QXJ19660.1 hypothetical protein AGRA3207_000225 [Actinomadura graeca]
MTMHIRPSTVHPGGPPAADDPLRTRTRLTGAALAAGTLAWVAGLAVAAGHAKDEIVTVEIVGSLLFLLGVLPMVALVHATRGTGERKGRAIPLAEMALLVPAMAWCPIALVYREDPPAWTIPFDLCWPLSMLGMLVLGAAVAKTGRYRGSLRWQFLLCGLWLVAALPAQALLGDTGGTIAGAAWLALTYGLLGVRLAVSPQHLTTP